MSPFLATLHSKRVLLMDGAMGTELQRAGIPDGERHELRNVTHPQRVQAIHQAYVDAGAECLVTNTFQVLPVSQAGRVRDYAQSSLLAQAALDLARSVRGSRGFVFVDIGPILETCGYRDLSGNQPLIALVQSLSRADAILLETYSTPQVADIVRFLGDVVTAVSNEGMPILLSLCFRRDAEGRLSSSSGHAPEWFAQQPGVAALGVNCGRDIGMDETIEIVRRYRQVTDLPLFARPNAGTPICVDGRSVYPQSPEMMAARLPELLEAGASMIGGCCGTTPEHIAAFRPIVESWNARRASSDK